MSHNQNGNVLFLILIAVALFAALSYAVTQSSRGSGSADREKRQTDISLVNNHIAAFRSEYLRRNIMESVVSPLHTGSGGFYDSAGSGGTSVMHPPLSLRSSSSGVLKNNFTYELIEARFYIETRDVGTSEDDIYLYLGGLTYDACVDINRDIWGGNTVIAMYFNAGTVGRRTSVRRDASLFDEDPANLSTVNLYYEEESCFDENETGKYSLLIPIFKM